MKYDFLALLPVVSKVLSKNTTPDALMRILSVVLEPLSEVVPKDKIPGISSPLGAPPTDAVIDAPLTNCDPSEPAKNIPPNSSPFWTTVLPPWLPDLCFIKNRYAPSVPLELLVIEAVDVLKLVPWIENLGVCPLTGMADVWFKIKSPPASHFIKEAAKLKGGSQEPGRNIVASITKKQAEEIAKKKMVDLNAHDLEEAVKIIAGSARSMGIEVKD